MKLLDFVIAGVIGILVALPVYLLVNAYLLNEDRFQANIEVVNPINEGFNTENTAIFTDEDRVDYSSPVNLNTRRNTAPFTNE